jgi:prolyl 4-hydroxylase
MRLTVLSKCPKIARVDNFLTTREASSIIELANRGEWLASTAGVVSGSEALRRVSGRTNKWCCVGNAEPVLRRAVERACWLTGLSPDHAEALQVVHYSFGQQYEYHVDHYTDRDVKSAAELEPIGGNRLISIFVYLSDCEGGGHTHFPRAGVRVAPSCGSALLWHNLDRHGLPDARTLHAGEPVEHGTKWGMNIWLKQRPRNAGAGDEEGDGVGLGGSSGSSPCSSGVCCRWVSASAPPLTSTTQKAREAATLRERNA